MLLEDALPCAECPICLQNLDIKVGRAAEEGEDIEEKEGRGASADRRPVLVDEGTADADNVINVDEPETLIGGAVVGQQQSTVSSSSSAQVTEEETTAGQLMRLLARASGHMTTRGDFMTAQHVHALRRETEAELHPDLNATTMTSSDSSNSFLNQIVRSVHGGYANSNNNNNVESKVALLSESQVEQGGAAVLMCGHLMHYLCALQLYEYTPNASCPVCRTRINSKQEIIRFHPRTSQVMSPQTMDNNIHSTSHSSSSAHVELSSSCEAKDAVHVEDTTQQPSDVLHQRPHCGSTKRPRSPEAGPSPPVTQQQHTSHPATSNTHTSSEDATKDEIVLIGARRLSPSHVYRDRLLRRARQYHARAENLSEREAHLQQSLTQLEEECRELTGSVSAARQRFEVMSAHGSLERLAELRQLCRETQHSCDCATAELAAATRESAELKAQIDKYAYKIQRLQ